MAQFDSNNQSINRDELLDMVLMSQAMQPGKLIQDFFDECMHYFTLFFRLNHNLKVAKVQVAAMEARNNAIKQYMNAHNTEAGEGLNLNTQR
jgi:hypothetical protein